MFCGIKKLPVNEYQLDSVAYDFKGRNDLVQVACSNYGGDLRFSGNALAIAISRTSFSKHPEDYLVFKSLTDANILKYSRILSNNFILSFNENIEYFMDFLKSGNTGEIGQGINYLLADRVLKYPYIINFESFIERYSRDLICGPFKSDHCILVDKKIETKRPDFILQKGLYRNVSILESKSTTGESVRAFLKKGLTQSISGEQVLYRNGYFVENIFISTVKLKKETDRNESKIYLIDPENKVINNSKSLEIIRFHYASWFAIIGDRNNAKRLLQNKPIQIEKEFKESLIHNGIEYFLINSLIPTGIRSGKIKVGIDKKVINLLKFTDEEIYEDDLNTKYYKEEYIDRVYEIFNDGTLVFI